MELSRVETLPTLTELFGHNKHVLSAVQKHFDTPAPLLAHDRQMLTHVPGIKMPRARVIEDALKRHGLRLRDSSESTSKYIERLFGCIEDAPIDVLQLYSLQANGVSHTYYIPLAVIRQLRQYEPNMAVVDLLSMHQSGVWDILMTHFAYDAEHLRPRISELNTRLRPWGLSLATPSEKRHLRAV